MAARTRDTRTALLGAGVGTAVLAWAYALGLDAAPAAPVVAVAVAVAAPFAEAVAHELGHLVACLLLRVPVRGVRVWGRQLWGRAARGGGRSQVHFEPSQLQRLVAVRVVAVFLAGPLADLTVAAVAASVALDAGRGPLSRAVAVGVCAAALVVAVTNLVPAGPAAHGDGAAVLAVVRRARGSTPAAAAARDLAAALRAAGPGNEDGAVWSLHGRLLRVVRQPDVPAAAVRQLAVLPAEILARALLSEQLRTGAPPPGDRVRAVGELAAAGHAAAPGDVRARAALALVHVLQGRDAEASALLDGIDEAGPAADVAVAYAVRALADAARGELRRAGECVAAAERLGGDDALVGLARRRVDEAAGRA